MFGPNHLINGTISYFFWPTGTMEIITETLRPWTVQPWETWENHTYGQRDAKLEYLTMYPHLKSSKSLSCLLWFNYVKLLQYLSIKPHHLLLLVCLPSNLVSITSNQVSWIKKLGDSISLVSLIKSLLNDVYHGVVLFWSFT